MRRLFLTSGIVGSLAATLAMTTVDAQHGDAVQALALEVAQLDAELQRLEAQADIERLQRIYGFYIDKQLWQQAADLFTEDAEFEEGGSGVYRGRERILAYLQNKGPEGPREGILNEQMQLQPIVTVSQDGTAKGRWHLLSQEAVHGESHYWGAGVYENEYRLEDGVWKISRLQLFTTMKTPVDRGWHIEPLPRSGPSESLPPDAPPSVDYAHFPAVHDVPFHYPHPVTAPSAPWQAAEPAADLQALEQQLSQLEQRAARQTDLNEVERLHVIYGYYLARNQWDDLTAIFTPDGTIEIALRGVYRGTESIRRNLNLYGVQDELHGELHNHMQYQPVIHISDDGQTAHMRSRALSMMGSFGGRGRWMGGVYENVFEKRDGIWLLHKDQVFNTYFADYETGWKDLVWMPAPGITESNPPDEPPSTYFEMYPRAFLPPFHYPNPVSGRVTEWEPVDAE